MDNMDWKKRSVPKPLIPNDKDNTIPSNDFAPIWDVNLNYITAQDLNNFYGYVPELDEEPDNPQLSNLVKMAIAISSEKVNSLTGNKIESIGFNNLNKTQQTLIKRATGRMTIYWLKNGMDFIRSSVSISGNGVSSSITPPQEPDYIIDEVYNLLQQANLYVVRKGISDSQCKSYVDFNSSTIWDEGDIQYPSWSQAFKTFLTEKSIISTNNTVGIKVISGNSPRIDLSVKNQEPEVTKEYVDNQDALTLKEANKYTDDTSNILDSKINTKQKKLEAGQNITIISKDENTDIISSAGDNNFYGYILEKAVDVNDTKYIFEEFDNDFWYLFNIEYEPIPNKKFAGSLERPAGITLDIVDSNVLNDQVNTSSATAVFDGKTKTLQVLSWDNPPIARKILHLNIFKKQLFKTNVNYETKEEHKIDIDNLKSTKQDILAIENERLDTGDMFVKYKDNQDEDAWNKASDNVLVSKNALIKGELKQGSLNIIDVNNPAKSFFKIAEGSGQVTWKNAYGAANDIILQSYPQNDNNFNILGKDSTLLINVDRQTNKVEIPSLKNWIYGEYKWMPIGSKMPDGWIKVDIPNGYTLTQGDNPDIISTKGQNIIHSHNFGSNRVPAADATFNVMRAGNVGSNDYVITTSSANISSISITNNSGGLLNIPASFHAELWQYKPTLFKTKKNSNF